MSAPDPVLAVAGLAKSYGATRALAGVSFTIAAGEVVGMVGTNGAGKSTLIKILSGAVGASCGEVRIGAVVNPATPGEAARAGVQTVHQEIDTGVVLGATVAENLTLHALAPGGGGWLRTARRTRAAARRIAAAAGLDVDLDAPVESLPASERQQVVIARALSRSPRLLVLDEPTSSLSARESDRLLASVRRLAAGGVAVLYVSHRLAEIERICDRVVVLRDGRVRREFAAPVRGRDLVEAMLGGTLSTLAHEVRAGGPTVLDARGVRTRPGARPFDLLVRAGEVVGVTGLVGAGKTELLEQLYGARPLVSGRLTVHGRPYAPRTPAQAVRAGVGLVAEERGGGAVVPGWSIRRHVTLPRLRAASHAGLMAGGLERDAARRTVADFGVVGPGVDADLLALSGGNQQKVLVGRWFDGRSTLLLLDEPFRGVDVGARADIAARLRGHAEVGLVVASSDPAEILQVADRVLVLAEGNLTGDLPADQVTTGQLSRLMAPEAA